MRNIYLCFLGWYFLLSLITLCLYAWDKRRARKNGWRVRERTLHLWEMAGGWPGAILGQNWFAHKRAKAGYMRFFWSIVVTHVVTWLIILYCVLK